MRFSTSMVAASAAMAVGLSVQADLIVDLGGGWQATIFNENKVDLVVDVVDFDGNLLIIQKFADFNEIDDITGLPAALSVAFTQTADDADTISRIALNDIFAFNNTGVNWNSFREILIGGSASFDADGSADFTIDPFTTRTYNDDFTEVEFSGGMVGVGDTWTPGLDDGALIIDIDLSGDAPVTFVLKELPVPAPGAWAVLVGGLLAGRRRRRS